MPFNKVNSSFPCLRALVLTAGLLGASSCTHRSETVDLILRGSTAESSEVVTLDPVFLSRQKEAETQFFGFESAPLTTETLVSKVSDEAPEEDVDVEVDERTAAQIKANEKFESVPSSGKAVVLTWPVAGRITSPFGIRHGRLHAGIDIGAPRCTPIISAASGQVLTAKVKGAYGNVVVIGHDHDAQTLYGHMLRMNVEEGQYVDAGTLLGCVGKTGRATGYHLHFETRLAGGIPQNPMRFLPKHDSAKALSELFKPQNTYAFVESLLKAQPVQR